VATVPRSIGRAPYAARQPSARISSPGRGIESAPERGMDTAASCSHNDTTMKNDAIFRLRLPRKELEALKRVAKDRRQPASDYVRELIWDHVRRADAIRRLHAMMDAMKPSQMTEEEAMELADEAKHASRR
jgi:hypothetical protein